jgi:phosphate-selective porin OprO/OprP
MVDGGYINANDELEEAFSDLEGGHADFRNLIVTMYSTLYDIGELKLQIDFANTRDIKDNWIRFTKIPFIGHITFGHMKEPFSIEELTSTKVISFMERALPVEAFTPGRNIGIRRQTTTSDQKMTWAAGFFLNTGSYGDVGDTKNQLSDATGYNLTARITRLPWYDEYGRKLLHLGLSYTHQIRDSLETDKPAQIRTRPESRLTDDRLVDTGEYLTDGRDIINPEFAIVSGPLSLQGEYFNVFDNSIQTGDLTFWGFYVYSSYFLTGEHRKYSTGSGTFTQIEPKHRFQIRSGGWGALELAFRISYVDLNSKTIHGGKEANASAGLNWYLNEKTRFMFNYIHAKVKDRETTPSIEDGRANILQVRFQIGF